MDTYSNKSLKTIDDFDSEEEYQEYLYHVGIFLDGFEGLLDEIEDEE